MGDEVQSPGVATFFFNHLQEKKPDLLSFESVDKRRMIHDWLCREGRIAN